MSQESTVVEGKRLSLSNLGKVLYPAAGFTKAQVLDYYLRVAPALLPQLRNRPLTLKRYPDGVRAPFFYEKECPSHRPAWARTVAIRSESEARTIHYCVVDDLPTLIWVANLAGLELHTSLSLADAIGRPTSVVFDLDPGSPASIVDCARVALWIRDLFEGLGLRSFPKTSGGKGLQIYVPLNTATDYDQTKRFARAVAQVLEQAHPAQVISRMKKSLRPGKVFVDWSQNDQHKTTVCAYSLRAMERPTVSTPVEWEEVDRALRKSDAKLLTFAPAQVLERVRRRGDLFAPVLRLRQRLPG